jgi:hypothetical protein
MRNVDSQGMMAFWTDIDEDYILDFQRWHNCQHMTERTSVPGFHVGRRYRGTGDAPMFFISYETVDSAVFKSQPYMDRLNNPTQWTQQALTHFNNNMRNIYRLTASAGAPAPTEAPFAQVYRFNLDQADEAGAVQWCADKFLPALAGLENMHRARLYEVDEEISNIQTAERGIYGGGPGEQKYLLYVEMELEDIPQGAAWQALWNDPENRKMLDLLKDVFAEASWLEFVMYGPEEK